MGFKQHFLYLADYQHWANDMLFDALDHLDDERRHAQQKLFYGSIHGSLDHLLFFWRKWTARIQGVNFNEGYVPGNRLEWRELKNQLRQEIRNFQRWLEQQPESFFDGKLVYRRAANQEIREIWVKDALTHLYTYASLERGHVSATASALGAPFPDMAYHTYRQEMGEHLEHLRKA
jgi:uncharacterized damage-inducible protein DinB